MICHTKWKASSNCSPRIFRHAMIFHNSNSSLLLFMLPGMFSLILFLNLSKYRRKSLLLSVVCCLESSLRLSLVVFCPEWHTERDVFREDNKKNSCFRSCEVLCEFLRCVKAGIYYTTHTLYHTRTDFVKVYRKTEHHTVNDWGSHTILYLSSHSEHSKLTQRRALHCYATQCMTWKQCMF